ncbi:hypothetical protein C8D89_107290 [Actinomycetospora cinnamomea]|uniref:Phasin domain-containing protein n=2 Tax=Actinomycetospora cinnamomea TaxID=663609 RepID=A0A2U1FAD0_9PSEU|nr:hypothetical protein C8D89_107290 [Actinomycetospora cinnamomea]
MTDPEQPLQREALRYTEQGQAATANLMNALSENWSAVMRAAGGVGSSAATSPPSPAELIDRSFDFTIRMIETQRAFAHQLLEAGMPVAQAMEQATDSVTDKTQHGTTQGPGGASDRTPG